MMRHAAFLSLLVTFPAIADRMPITDIRPLLVSAINSFDGTAKGVMVGEVAELMRRRGGSSFPIEVDVRTVAEHPQAGCKRLEVATRQKAVIEPGKKFPEDKAHVYRVNFCADGRFPAAGEK